jgi:hypothetical protein
MLLRNAAMRHFVVGGTDDPGLRIVPADRLDTGGSAKGRVAAIRGDDEPRRDRLSIRQIEHGGIFAEMTISKFSAVKYLKTRLVRGSGKRAPGNGVFDNPSKWPVTDFGVVVMQEKGRRAVGNTDFENWFGVIRHVLPQAESFQDSLRTCCDRGAASIKTCRSHVGQTSPLDQGNRHACSGKSQCETQPDHPAANDDHVE